MFRPCHSNRGSAVLIVLAVLGIMMVLLAANTRIALTLNRELKLVEQRQLKHWSSTLTNAPVASPKTPAPIVQP